MNRRKFVTLFGGTSAALSSPRSFLDVFAETPKHQVEGSGPAGATERQKSERRKFPTEDYVPFGYLDNPAHSAVLNRSGVLRSVPPLGFGYWTRRMPWPYGEGALRNVNYLSILHLSVNIDGTLFHHVEDFKQQDVKIVSKYHTKNLMSLDWTFKGIVVRVLYAYASRSGPRSAEDAQAHCQDSIVAVVNIENVGTSARPVLLHATNIYGYPEEHWWGSDGVVAEFLPSQNAAVSKIWAYGDVFAVGADRKSFAQKATCSELEWETWIRNNDRSSNSGATSPFPGAVHTMQSYSLPIPPGGRDAITISLTRGANQQAALDQLESSISGAQETLESRFDEDDAFYAGTPVLTGDWSPEWKHGWIYDLETLRMTVRPPLGIYKHPWDGMQIFTPRAVLGETLLDSLTLSYCSVPLAKSVILGMFADAPAPNLPCSREDGSVNMICADGSEAGTAPTWGMPFHVIRSIFNRDGDSEWIKALYPHMKSFLNWWLEKRTDKDGWFHCKCSWESGQDGSKRFIVAEGNPAAVSDFVRTADVEAAMADAFRSMVVFSEVAGRTDDRERWKQLADKRIESTRSMCVDGWFRDFDARNDQPIVLKDYYDVMMLYPVAAGIATEEQMKSIAPRFQYFADHPIFWLEWPSFMLPYSEAAWNTGLREFLADVIGRTATRVYARTDAQTTRPIAPFKSTLPERYQYRIPGIANEFWPIEQDNPGGCENYGWGATLPALIIRNIIGFREFDDFARNEFRLAPALPSNLLQPGKSYGISNLLFRGSWHDVTYQVGQGKKIQVTVSSRSESGRLPATVKNSADKVIATAQKDKAGSVCRFSAENGEMYTVSFS